VAHDAGTNHVGYEFVLATIPGKEHRTRTATPIQFSDSLDAPGHEIYFVLRHARRPQQAYNFSIFLSA
jgi:hypothetical protein